MTGLKGSSVYSAELAALDAGHHNLAKLPPNAPDVISKNIVIVSDPDGVLPWSMDKRRRSFNLLVRR